MGLRVTLTMAVASQEAGTSVHVDGAFGLWTLANPDFTTLTDGLAEANSWATDGHKWLNVPYDSGIAFVSRAADLRAAMSASAANLAEGAAGDREPSHYTPESSSWAKTVHRDSRHQFFVAGQPGGAARNVYVRKTAFAGGS